MTNTVQPWGKEFPDTKAFNAGYWSFFNDENCKFRNGTSKYKEFMRGWNAAYFNNIKYRGRKKPKKSKNNA